MPGYISAPKGCPGTYGQEKGVREHMVDVGTGIVPELIWAPEGCPDTYVPEHK